MHKYAIGEIHRVRDFLFLFLPYRIVAIRNNIAKSNSKNKKR